MEQSHLTLDTRGGIKIIVTVVMTGRNREKSNPFTLEIKALTNNITREENVFTETTREAISTLTEWNDNRGEQLTC